MGSGRSEMKDWRKITTLPEVSAQVDRLRLMGNSPEAVLSGLLNEMKGQSGTSARLHPRQ